VASCAHRKEIFSMTDGKKSGFGLFSWFGRRKRDEPHDADATGVEPQETASKNAPPSSSALKADTPACPKCGAAMYQRFNLQTRRMQWGCIQYPACKGTREL
jgi:hypothetical protein